jgi:hypothetical protein
MLRLTEDDAPCFFGHDFDVADLFQAFEDDLLGETVGADSLVSGVTDPNYL